MKLYKHLTVFAVLTVVVSSTTIPPSAKANLQESPLTKESSNNTHVRISSSVGQVEVPAVVQEVKGDWIDNGGEDDIQEKVHADEDENGEINDEYEYDDEDEENAEDEENDEGVYENEDINEESGFLEYDYADAATQEEFEANVPSAIHENKDVIINKDNLIPILKSIVLAYTHKEKPSLPDMLKAGGISFFKTVFKHFGKENIGANLLKMAKILTGPLDNEISDDINSEILAELAEEYLSSHRFKLVLPESVLLHKAEMDEFLAKRDLGEIEGRSVVSNRQFDISMPRTDPAVQTILTIGPMTWMALIGGLFSIPYLFSGSSEPARVDHVIPNPSPYLRAPGLPFFQSHQLRRDEEEHVSHQQIDQEYLEYQQSYAQWYNQWYLRYKSYYDEHYPNHQQPHPSTLQQEQSSLDVMVPPPPVNADHVKFHSQKPLHPPQKPLPPKQQLPKQPPPFQGIHLQNPVHQPFPVAGNNVRLDSARHAGANIVSTAEDKPNTFGTFQSEGNRPKADTHFKVIQGQETNQPTTPRSRPRIPSPQPVYVPTTEAPKTERGFKPITKVDSSTVNPNTESSLEDKAEFRAPKDETVLSKNSSPKEKSPSPSNSAGKTAGGFKPIPSPADPTKKESETSPIKISEVTSGVFKTSTEPTSSGAPIPAAASTVRPAVFVRTATQKSVRVVTSSSIVVPNVSASGNSGTIPGALPDLKRPQRHQQSTSSTQHISNQQQQQPKQARPLKHQQPLQQQHQQQQQQQQQQVLHQQPLPVHERLPLQQRPPQQSVAGQHQPNQLNTGFIRTNIPTVIKVVDHRPAQGFGLGPKPTTKPTTTTTTPMPIYALDPFYGSRLSRIDVIFHQLGVEEEGCREQVVCNIYKNPDAYTPFSDFLSRQLTVKLEELQKPKVSDERILRFFRYLKAAREGQDGSDCVSKYPECHFDTTQLSHQPIMNAFQKVSLLMNAGSS